MEYTKGEWKAEQYRVRAFKDKLRERWYVVASDGTVIAENLTEANAQLIASAPNLYEALRAVADERYILCGDDRHEVAIREQAEQALAKAEGEPMKK